MKSFLPILPIVLCFCALSCAKVIESRALDKNVKASQEKEKTEKPDPAIKTTKPKVLNLAPVPDVDNPNPVDDLAPVVNVPEQGRAPIVPAPQPLVPAQEKIILGKPVASFANDLDIADKFGVIKAVDNTINRSRIMDIDYPYIVWDAVTDATGYKIYRKHDGEEYTELTDDLIGIMSPIESVPEDSNFKELHALLKTKYSYADRSLSPERANNRSQVLRKYYYKVKAIGTDANHVESDPIEITLVPGSAEKAFKDIFKKNLGYLLYSSDGFRRDTGSSTYNISGTVSGTYTKKVSIKNGSTYTYDNYSEHKGAVIVNGTLTAEIKGKWASGTIVINNGELSITGPYKATVQFKDFTLKQKAKQIGVYDEDVDDFVSGTISINYQDNKGNELGSKTYTVGTDSLSALITTSEDL